MSAFLCGARHVGTIAAFCREQSNDGDATLKAISNARKLGEANLDSLAARYPDCKDRNGAAQEFGGFIHVEAFLLECEAWASRDVLETVTPVLVLKMCDCLEYQSCEIENYLQSEGFLILDSLRGVAIRALAGYEEAPGWDYVAEVA